VQETWKVELDRVYSDLDQIEKECILGKGRAVVADEIEESRVRVEQLVMLLKEIKGTCHPKVQFVFQKVASSLEYELDKIRK
jgi:hypothetical protein